MFPDSSVIKQLGKHVPKSKLRPIGGQKKREDIPYERILIDQNPDKANHFTYRTGRTRIIPWLQALTQFYSSNKTISGECIWFNEKGLEVDSKSDCIAWVTLNTFNQEHKPLDTFTVHLKKGLIDAQVSHYGDFAQKAFPEILKTVNELATPGSPTSSVKTDSSATHLNSTVTETSDPAKLPKPDVSPVKPDGDDEYLSAHSDTETDSENEDDEHSKSKSYVPELDKTLAAACFNLDNTVISLRDELVNTCRAQASDLTAIKNGLSVKEKTPWDTKTVKAICDKIDNIEKDCGRLKSLTTKVHNIESDVSTIKTDIKALISSVQDIKNICNKPPKHVTVVDASTEPWKYDTAAGLGSAPVGATRVADPPQPDHSTTQKTQKPNTTDDTNPWITVGQRRANKRDTTTKIRSSATGIVIADSLPRDIVEAEVDSTECVQIKTFGGGTCSSIEKTVNKFPVSPNIKKVLAHVGFNDVRQLSPMTRTNISMLITALQNKFPNAEISFSLILPTKDGVTKTMESFNESCKTTCFNRKIPVVDYGEHFLNKENLYNEDTVHLNDDGSAVFGVLLRNFFGGTPPKQEAPSRDKSNPDSKPIPVIGENVKVNIDPSSSKINIVSSPVNQKARNNYFQGFGAVCKSHEEARIILDKIKKEFPWTAKANNLMKVYCVYKNGRLKYRMDDDGEKGAGARMAWIMQKIGMENCFILIARDATEHIYDARWEIIQEQLCDVASKLGYSIPHDIDVVRMFPKERSSNTSRFSKQDYTTYGKPVKPLFPQRSASYHYQSQKQSYEPHMAGNSAKFSGFQQNIPPQQSFHGGNYMNNYPSHQYHNGSSSYGQSQTWTSPSSFSQRMDYTSNPPQRYHMDYYNQLAANLQEFNMADQTAWRPM